MQAKVILYWSTPVGDVELGSTVSPPVLRAAKHSLLRAAKQKVADNLGKPMKESSARFRYEVLEAMLDNVIPEPYKVGKDRG